MSRLPLLPLAVPFACLALLSLVAFLGVVAIAGALYVVRAIKSGLGRMPIARTRRIKTSP